MNTIYDEIEEYRESLKTRIRELKRYASVHPGKHLIVANDRGIPRFRIYDSSTGKSRYISASEGKLIGSLSNKRYAEDAMRVLAKNLKAAEKFLSAHSGLEEFQISDSYKPVMRQLNGNISRDYDLIRQLWAQLEYERNPYHYESLMIPGVRGEMYRSKSECIIADALFDTKLAYIPEYPLELNNGGVIYPDFKIMVPFTFDIKYWEHFGLMDDPEYASKSCKRIRILNDNGIILGKNLIATFETRDCPLSKPYVMSIINEFLLE